MGSGFRLGRIAGIDLMVDWSVAVIVVLVTVSLAGNLFVTWHPDWSAALSWLVALTAALLLLASILVHELSHALVSGKMGTPVRRITLFIFGGVAQIDDEPKSWQAEFWTAIVGPVTSVVLGIIMLVVGQLVAGPLEIDPQAPQIALARVGPLGTLLLWLGPVNLVLGAFNMVPGFPLDGGRVARALLWASTGDLRKATRWASRGGQAFAWLLMACGGALLLGARLPLFGAGFANGLWLIFIGWFLNSTAIASYQQLLVRQALEHVPVARLMRPDVTAVPPQLDVQTLVDGYFMRSDQHAFAVTEGAQLLGLVAMPDLQKVARELWPSTTVAQIMTPASQLALVTPEQDTIEAMRALANRDVAQLPVVDHGVFRGLLRRDDILKWLSVSGLGSPISHR